MPLGQNTCTIEGKGAVGKGWITIENDMAKFYVLFTRKGAQVEYIEDQGCGAGVSLTATMRGSKWIEQGGQG